MISENKLGELLQEFEERLTALEAKAEESNVSDELAKIQSTLSGLDRNLFNICIAINRSNTNEPLRPGGTFF